MAQVFTTTAVPNVWHLLADWPVTQRPAALWDWLAHTDSLTEKLRAAMGPIFHVQVLNEDQTPLAADDARLLAVLPGTRVRRREVYLCGHEPWVYARTLAAHQDDGERWLEELGTRPLGERLFAEAGAHRGPIESAMLDNNYPLYRAAIQRYEPAPAMLWARRSVLTVQNARLLIYECFLRGVEV